MVLVYLVSFFKEMLNYSDKNKLSPEKVSELLCECLIGDDMFIGNIEKSKESFIRAVTSSPKKL